MLPLSNLLVIDLSRLVPGPLCAHVLAAQGAYVIKIEDEANPDYLQGIPPKLKNKKGAMYSYLNQHKRIQKLSIKNIEDQKQLLKLISKADVLIETFRPGVLKKLGLDPKKLLKLNKKLIIASISGYGARGILSQKAGHDLNYQALSGMLHAHKAPKVLWADLIGGAYYSSLTIMSALLERGQTKKGKHLDISLTQGLAFLNALSICEKQVGSSNNYLDGSLARYRIYLTSDNRQIAFAALEDKFWNKWCDLVGKQIWRDAGGTYPDRQMIVHQEMELLIKSKSYQEWVHFLVDCDFCVTPVLSEAELIDPQNPFQATFFEALGGVKVPQFQVSGQKRVSKNWQTFLKNKKIPYLLMKKILKESSIVGS